MIRFKFHPWDNNTIVFIGGSINNYILHSGGIIENTDQYYYLWSPSNDVITCTNWEYDMTITLIKNSTSVWDIRE